MPIPLEKLKINISGSGFSGEQKTWLLSHVSNFGEKTQEFINRKLSERDFNFIKDDLFKAFQEMFAALEALKQSNEALFAGLLKDSLENPDYGSGSYILSIFLDAKKTGWLNQKINPGLQTVINYFELQLFQSLPQSELLSLVQNNILYFIHSQDIVMAFKRLYLIPSMYEQTEWIEPFRAALEANEEYIGNQKIKMGDQAVPPTISNWLKDYITFTPGSVSEKGGYTQVKYIEQSSNIKLLGPDDKKILLEVLKLYSWFLEPTVTETEIDLYDEELAKKNQKVKPVKVPEVSNRQQQSLPPVDWVKAAAQRREEEQQKIDVKLNELKSKIK